MRPALLADALERVGARVAYLQPLHANPHGADLPAQRRAEVMEVAARGSAGARMRSVRIVEDLFVSAPLQLAALVAAAARAGVMVAGCRRSFAAEPTGPHLRLTFGGAPPDVLVEGAGRLAGVLEG